MVEYKQFSQGISKCLLTPNQQGVY